MRPLRKLMTLSVVAASAIAVTAPSASALEAVTESNLQHCTAINQPVHGAATGGCPIRVGASGVCNHNLEARINESGFGYIYNPSITGCVGTAFHACHEGATGFSIDPWRL